MIVDVRVEATPVQHCAHVSRALGCDVFVKRDDLTHARYGGNKIRKLVPLLEAAQAARATDLVTAGSVGSHHVLATVVHGRALGFAVRAVVAPQPFSPQAERTARASVAQGGVLVPAPGAWAAPALLARELLALRARGRRPFVLAPGGSSPLGTVGYLEAVRELDRQRARGELPGWPEVMVCALGSGGTHAGILAGVRALGAASEVVGVQIVGGAWPLAASAVAWMARRALWLAWPEAAARGAAGALPARAVRIDRGQCGRGYGHPTDAAREARALFARDGIELDLTYTAKAAAGLLALARRGPPGRSYLFWHTLSTAPLEPLLGELGELPREIRALLR